MLYKTICFSFLWSVTTRNAQNEGQPPKFQ